MRHRSTQGQSFDFRTESFECHQEQKTWTIKIAHATEPIDQLIHVDFQKYYEIPIKLLFNQKFYMKAIASAAAWKLAAYVGRARAADGTLQP